MEKLVIKNPYTNEIVQTVELMDEVTLNNTIYTCSTFKSSMSRYTRSNILLKASQLLKTRLEQAALLITSESGLSLNDSRYEVQRVINILELGSQLTNVMVFENIFHSDNVPNVENRRIYTNYEPINLIAAITPFNHPMNQVAHKVIPAIATNNKIILKPSLKTPLSAIYFRDLLYECGLPKQMFNVVICKDNIAIDQFVNNKLIELITFTGSYKVGKLIASKCFMKRVILELGGCDPMIILDDANIELAVKLAVKGSFQNTGQRCTAVKRLIVAETIANEFVSRFKELTEIIKYGNPFDKENDMGTLIDEGAAWSVYNAVNKAISDGAKLIYGNKIHKAVLSPTILDYVPSNHHLVQEDIFGPVAPIIRFNNIEEALQIANNTNYGLSSGVITSDLNKAIYFIKNLKSGMVNINEVPSFRSEIAPFGGIKYSGLGIKEGLIEAMRNYQNVKVYSMAW